MAGDVSCDKCGHYRGHANTLTKGKWVFVCSHCWNGEDMSIEIAEQRRGC